MAARQSAGLLLYRPGVDGPEVLLVHPGGPFFAGRDDGVWSLPKGEIEQGEDAVDVALREFEEELGVPPPVTRDGLAELGSITQRSGKVVTAFGAMGDLDISAGISSNTFTLEWPPKSGSLRAFPEVDRAEWLSLAAARVKLIPAQVELIDLLEALLDGSG